MKKSMITPTLIFGLLFLFAGEVLGQAVPASQPSKNREGIRVQCNSWEKSGATEGECQVDSEQTNWKVQFSMEGDDFRGLKYYVRNLLVLFPPDGSNHKVHEWWGDMVGPKGGIDTDDWIVLALNYPQGNNSKISLSVFLTADEILAVSKAVIEYLFPRRIKYVVGGASRGAQAALLYAQKYPDEVSGLFMVGYQGANLEWDLEDGRNAIAELDAAEMEHGPYEFWKKDVRDSWWNKRVSEEITLKQYTEEYFGDPKWMVDLGKESKDYKDKETFKKEVVQSWVDYFRDNEHPRPLYQKGVVLSEASIALKKKDLRALPSNIFLLTNKLDQFDSPTDVKLFKGLLEAEKKKVSVETYKDVRGHTACCVPDMPEAAKKPLESWLRKTF